MLTYLWSKVSRAKIRNFITKYSNPLQVNTENIFQHEFEGTPHQWLQRAFSHSPGSPHSTSSLKWKSCKKKTGSWGHPGFCSLAESQPHAHSQNTHRHPRWEDTVVNLRQEDASRECMGIKCLCLPPRLAGSCLVGMGNQR